VPLYNLQSIIRTRNLAPILIPFKMMFAMRAPAWSLASRRPVPAPHVFNNLAEAPSGWQMAITSRSRFNRLESPSGAADDGHRFVDAQRCEVGIGIIAH